MPTKKDRRPQPENLNNDGGVSAFFGAFNDIEQHLRSRLQAKNSDAFWWLVDRAFDKHMLNKRQAEMLKDYAKLRNAIAHGRYFDGEPIAQPHPQVVDNMVAIARVLTDPPTALEVVGRHTVTTLAPEDDVYAALQVIAKHGFSQIPIYDNGTFVQLLSPNVIARWIAADLDDNHVLDAASITEILKFGQPADEAAILPTDATAQEVIDILTEVPRKGRQVHAVIITEHGQPTEKPIRILTHGDLAALMDAVDIY